MESWRRVEWMLRMIELVEGWGRLFIFAVAWDLHVGAIGVVYHFLLEAEEDLRHRGRPVDTVKVSF